MSNIQTIIRERLASVSQMIKAAANAADLHVEQSKIRLALPIQNGRSQYVFDLKNTPADNVVTFGLNRNDVFIPFAWQVFIALKHKASRVSTLYTFAPINDGTNPSAYPVGFADGQINALYGGNLQWMVGSEAMFGAFPMENFHKVPETQPCFVLNSDDEAVQQSIQLQRSMTDDLELMYPKVIVAGTRDHKISVNFDAANLTFALAGADASEYEAELVLYMDGALVKGGCQNGDASPFGKVVGNW